MSEQIHSAPLSKLNDGFNDVSINSLIYTDYNLNRGPRKGKTSLDFN